MRKHETIKKENDGQHKGSEYQQSWNALELESEVTSRFMQEIRQLRGDDRSLNVSILHTQ